MTFTETVALALILLAVGLGIVAHRKGRRRDLALGKRVSFIADRNPYRRFCAHCGQCQTQYCYSGEWNRGWWETQGAVPDPDCICHSVLHPQHQPRTWMTETSTS